MSWLLGLDFGGGGGRALLLDADSGRVVCARRSWAHRTAAEGGGIGVDLDLATAWERLGAASRETMAAAGIASSEVAALAVSGMRFACILQDAGGKVLYSGSNRDGRAAGTAIAMALEDDAESTALRVGHWPSSVLAASRLRWLRTAHPELWERGASLLSASDWLVHRLCGEMATDPTQASTTGFYALDEQAWDQERSEALGIPASWLPPIRECGTAVGGLQTAAATHFGLAAGTPVVIGGADSQLALLAVGVMGVGEVGLVAGSTAPVQRVTDGPVCDPSLWCERFVLPGHFVLESSAGSLGHLIESLAGLIHAEARDPVAKLLADAGRAEAGAGGRLATLSTPVMDARRLELPIASLSWASMLGGPAFPESALASRAGVEATAYALRANLEHLAECLGSPATKVAVAGRLSGSATWRRVVANVLGVPLQSGASSDSSALGAALCAGVGSGLFVDLAEAATSVERFATETVAKDVALYADFYPTWRKICDARADADRAAADVMLAALLRSRSEVVLAEPTHRPRILVTADFDEAGLARLRELGDVEYRSYRDAMRLLTGEALVEALAGFDVFITEIDVVEAAAFAKLPALRVVASCRGDSVNIDQEAASVYGVPLLEAPGRNAEAVADLSVAFVLAGLRKLFPANAFLHEEHEAGDLGRMGRAYSAYRGRELGGACVGLLGLGAVGSRVAKRLHAFGARVLAFDPAIDAEAAALYEAEWVSMERLLAESDVLSLHAPVNDATRGLLGRDELARMQPGAFLVNTARAALVDEDALVEALESGALSGAALDVFAEEPPGSDHPLLRLPNVITTPHLGGNTYEVAGHQARIVGADLARLLRGERPLAIANPEVLEGFDWSAERPAPDPLRVAALADRPPPSVSDLQQGGKRRAKSRTAEAEVNAPAELIRKLEQVLEAFVAGCVGDEALAAFAADHDLLVAFRLSDVGLGVWLRLRTKVRGGVGEPEEEPDVELRLTADVFDGMFTGRVNGMQASMEGKLSFTGDAAKAMTMQEVQRDFSRIWKQVRNQAGDLGDLSALAVPTGEAATPVAADDLRPEIVRVVSELYTQQVITATGGNVSARIPGEDEIWITPSQLFKGDLSPSVLVRLDLAGKPLDPGQGTPSSERLMHCAVYAARSEAAAVVHAHAPFATILANTGLPFLPISTEAAFFDELPRVPFIMPGTQALADAIFEAMSDSWACLMVNHGLLVAGRSLRRAADMVEIIERTSEVILGCYSVGKEPPVLPDDAVATLRKMGDLIA
ncbi:MAG: NAD(P)-dependent oxidoreductase [Myxococcota bacterium]